MVVYDIYFINQLLKNDNNKNKQTKNKAKKKIKIKIKKQSDKQRSIEIVHKGLLHMCLHIKTHSNGEFNTTLVSNNLTDYGRRKLIYFVLNITK